MHKLLPDIELEGMRLKSHPLKLSLNCLHWISIIYCGNENGCIDFLFLLINLRLCFSTNEHQVNPNQNGNTVPHWIRNMLALLTCPHELASTYKHAQGPAISKLPSFSFFLYISRYAIHARIPIFMAHLPDG